MYLTSSDNYDTINADTVKVQVDGLYEYNKRYIKTIAIGDNGPLTDAELEEQNNHITNEGYEIIDITDDNGNVIGKKVVKVGD